MLWAVPGPRSRVRGWPWGPVREWNGDLPMSPADAASNPVSGPPGPTGAPIRPSGWPEVDRAVARLLAGVAQALGDALAGLYLGGSLGLGDSDPASSDVDVLVATAGRLPGPAVERLRRLHRALRAEGGWAARLEVVYLPLAALRRFDPMTPSATRSGRPTAGSTSAGRRRPGSSTAGWPASTGWSSSGPTRGS